MWSRRMAPMVTGLLRANGYSDISSRLNSSEKIVQRNYLVSAFPELGQDGRKYLRGAQSPASAIMKNHDSPGSRIMKDVAGRP